MPQSDVTDSGVPREQGDVPVPVLRALMEFSAGLRKYGMYPADHPVLVPVAERVREQLAAALAASKALLVKVERESLEVAGSKTDASNPLLSGFASCLHAHRLRSVTFRRGIQRDEVAGFLQALANEVDRGRDPLGLAPEKERDRWPHVRIVPLEYDPLRLGNRDPDLDALEGQGGASVLETPPFSTEIAGVDLLREKAGKVATAVEERRGGDAVDRWIAVQMFHLGEELREASGEAADVVRRRMSEVIRALEPQTLAYLLSLGDEGNRTNRFLRNSAEWMESDAIITLVRTAGENRQDPIAPWLVRLTSKLARYGVDDARPEGKEADSAIRSVVQRLASEWELDDPRPSDYADDLTAFLRQAPAAPAVAADGVGAVEPLRVVETSIEIDEPNDLLRRASGRLVTDGDIPSLLDRLERAPDGSRVARELWAGLSTPHAIRHLLEVEPPKFDVCDRIIASLGPDAAEPMLEVLARSRHRAVRRYLFDKISQMGPGVGPSIVALLGDSRWYVVRNMLGLLRVLGIWPPGFDVVPYVRHKEARVRVEAAKLAAGNAEHRDVAICLALGDDDERVVALGLSEATRSCPPKAEAILLRHLRRRRLSEELRVQAIRALGTLDSPRAWKGIVKACRRRRWIFFSGLESEYPLVLAGVRAIGRRRPDTRAARHVLRMAARSDDSELKWAAAGADPSNAAEETPTGDGSSP